MITEQPVGTTSGGWLVTCLNELRQCHRHTNVGMTYLESVPGQGDVGESDGLAVGLPHLKVLEQHHSWGGLEGLPFIYAPHDHLDTSVGPQCCICRLTRIGGVIQCLLEQVKQAR